MKLFAVSCLLTGYNEDGEYIASHTLHWMSAADENQAKGIAITKANLAKPLLGVRDVICSEITSGEDNG